MAFEIDQQTIDDPHTHKPRIDEDQPEISPVSAKDATNERQKKRQAAKDQDQSNGYDQARGGLQY